MTKHWKQIGVFLIHSNICHDLRMLFQCSKDINRIQPCTLRQIPCHSCKLHNSVWTWLWNILYKITTYGSDLLLQSLCGIGLQKHPTSIKQKTKTFIALTKLTNGDLTRRKMRTVDSFEKWARPNFTRWNFLYDLVVASLSGLVSSRIHPRTTQTSGRILKHPESVNVDRLSTLSIS